MRALRTRLGAFGRAFANPDIRRVQLAHGGSLIGTWSYAIALFVYAYDHVPISEPPCASWTRRMSGLANARPNAPRRVRSARMRG